MTKFKVELPTFEHWQRTIKCQHACPVHTDARGYVTAIAEGDFEKAYTIAREPNPFASICGRVCAAPCEIACRRGDIDEPIAIRALKRFATERYGVEARLLSGKNPSAPEKDTGIDLICKFSAEIGNFQDVSALRKLAGANKASSGKKVAVIGSGVAGLTCAHDLALLGHSVTVFEAKSVPGGMLVLGVPEYRLPRDLVKAEIQAILDLGVELKANQALGRDFLLKDLKAQGYEAIFIAIGAHKSRGLRIEGVELDGVLSAIEFLLNRNLGYKVDLGQRVVVVGGGDVAMDAARTALRGLLEEEAEAALKTIHVGPVDGTLDAVSAMREAMDVAREAIRTGAREVDAICLESWEEMPAQRFEVEEALVEGVKIHTRLGPKRILGEDGKVKGLEVLKVRSVFDEQHRFNPTFIEGSESALEADSVILAIGQSSDLSFLKPEDGIEVTPRGTIKVDLETMATTAPGIFAGGDVALGPRIFIEGVETGHRAARGIHEYVSGQKLKMVKLGSWTALDHRGQFLSREGPKGRSLPIVNPNYLRTPRKEPPSLPIDRRVGIAEIELGYDQDGAVEQASRCVRCGINPIFDGDKCILCGGCVDVCPEYCFRMVSLEEMEEAPELSRLVESRFGLTLRAFQENASYRSKGSAMIMDTDRCIRCSLCALRCPTGAISMESFKFTEELA